MKVAVIGSQAPPQAVGMLQAHGFRTVMLPQHPALPAPVASHPDMLLFFDQDRFYTFPSYAAIAGAELLELQELTGMECCTVAQEPTGTYPGDIPLNAARVGDRLFCLAPHTAPELTSLPGVRTVSIRQGYAKCSTLPVTDSAIITSDPSVAHAAESEGMEVLRICPGYIRLPGYNTGFIGGCASCDCGTDSREIFFCGDPAEHPDGDSILRFCARHRKPPVVLTPGMLTDVGTIFLIQ